MKGNWIKHTSIKDLPDGIWDIKIAHGNASISASFMDIVEKINKHDIFFYFIVSDSIGHIVGIAFAYRKKFSIWGSKKKNIPIDICIPILMTATLETYGKHYWFDSNYYTEEVFLGELYTQLEQISSPIIMIRDYVDENFDKNIINYFNINRFIQIKSQDVFYINLKNKVINNINDYLSTLKKKHRNDYKNILSNRDKQGLKLQHICNISEHIDYLYPLYLNVNSKAKDFVTEPLPIDFFKLINQDTHVNSHSIILWKDNIIIGFILSLEDDRQIVPFLMGMDYSMLEYDIWKNLLLECIDYAILKQKEKIDLGLTNPAMKLRLGAEKYGINMFARFKSNTANSILCRFLPMLMK
jgi:hypothetical protein